MQYIVYHATESGESVVGLVSTFTSWLDNHEAIITAHQQAIHRTSEPVKITLNTEKFNTRSHAPEYWAKAWLVRDEERYYIKPVKRLDI